MIQIQAGEVETTAMAGQGQRREERRGWEQRAMSHPTRSTTNLNYQLNKVGQVFTFLRAAREQP